MEWQDVLKTVNDRRLLEQIRHCKDVFEDLFVNVSNRLNIENDLYKETGWNKGSKISKGNELEHCPYQVLDVIRDFDRERGLNIRVLNWWGRGLFFFLMIGKDNPLLNSVTKPPFSEHLIKERFKISQALSLWAYGEIIDHSNYVGFSPASFTEWSKRSSGPLHLFNKMAYASTFEKTEEMLYGLLRSTLVLLRDKPISSSKF